MASQYSVVIDGRPVIVPAGTSVLEAARRAGVTIPALCHHPALPVDGSCRLCLVEVEGRAGLHASCAIPVSPGRRVITETPAVVAARRHVLGLLMARYRPGAGRPRNELLALADQHGVSPPPAAAAPRSPVDDSNPFIRIDREACIHCWRCVRACSVLNGVTAIGVFGRGQDAHIGFGADRPMQDSPCEFCGMCEAVCPTDALLVREPSPTRGGAQVANTVCGYCGVGCRLDLLVEDGRVAGTACDWDAAANHGLLCVKGRFGWRYVHHRDRLTRPRVRRALLGGGEGWVDTDWDTALDVVARKLADVTRRHGPEAVGLLASAKCTNEENYLVQKLARQVLGTNNVDHCARLCHAPTVVALTEALGSGAMTNSMDDIVAEAQAVFVVGSNTTEQHPVLGMRLRAAARERGLPIIVADPRRIPLAEVAALHLPLRPGTDIALLNALAHVLVANDWVDHGFVGRHTEGFEAFASSVRDTTPEWAAGITGVPARDMRRAAELMWRHRPGALLFAMGITQHTCGTANAFACTNLQLLLGNLGMPGSGINPLRGQNNVQGACDVGALPDMLPGYQPVADEVVRRRFAEAWGVAIPDRPGLSVTEMIDAAFTGGVRALYIVGENAAMTDPDLTHVRRCLSACEFLVVQEIFPSETAELAHVVLPAAASFEKAGTFTSTERRVQRVAPAVLPPGDARADWWILAEIGRRVSALLGRPTARGPYAGWHNTSPAATMEEIAALAPIYGGIRHERLGEAGLQWPCPTSNHPGTPILHRDGPSRGRARFVPVRHTPAAEMPDAEYPLVLTTGRVLEHYHAGSMSRRVPALDWLVPEAIVEIHPTDAHAAAIADGERIRVRSRRGTIVARARVTPTIRPGTVFVPFHFAEAAANLLTHAALDPVAKIPEYKACAVVVEAAR